MVIWTTLLSVAVWITTPIVKITPAHISFGPCSEAATVLTPDENRAATAPPQVGCECLAECTNKGTEKEPALVKTSYGSWRGFAYPAESSDVMMLVRSLDKYHSFFSVLNWPNLSMKSGMMRHPCEHVSAHVVVVCRQVLTEMTPISYYGSR